MRDKVIGRLLGFVAGFRTSGALVPGPRYACHSSSATSARSGPALRGMEIGNWNESWKLKIGSWNGSCGNFRGPDCGGKWDGFDV